jgi:hypothetical protein
MLVRTSISQLLTKKRLHYCGSISKLHNNETGPTVREKYYGGTVILREQTLKEKKREF